MKNSTLLLKISRPRFWLYLAGPFLLGFIGGMNTLSQIWTAQFLLPFFFFLLPANLFLYGVNDWFDADTDQLNQKKGEFEHLLRQHERKVLGVTIAVCFGLSLVLGVLFVSTAALLIVFMFLSCFYSAPPLRFKSRAGLDSLSNVLYIIPGLIGYNLAAGDAVPWLIILACGAWAVGMHAYSAIPDIQPDSRAGIRTGAVSLGARNTLLVVLGFWAFFSTVSILLYGYPLLLTLIYPAVCLFLLLTSKQLDLSAATGRLYVLFPYLNGLVGFLGFAYIIFTRFW